MTETRILVVDDDEKIRGLLRNCMEGEGYSVVEANSAQSALDNFANDGFDLMTLDIHLGDDDGFEIAKKIRRTSNIPIIMVTGKEDVIDRVVGLEIGADDYITKPFHVREVLARIRSVLRRAAPLKTSETGEDANALPAPDPKIQAPGQSAVIFDELMAVPERMALWDRSGKECDLTSGDFQLLNVFLTHPKRVLSRDQLMDLTGGSSWSPLDRTIDNKVARLRKKIERDPSNAKLIKTVRGIGYMLACDVRAAKNRVLESES